MSISSTQKKEILNLLFILGSAITFALLIVLFFLFRYGPSGNFLASNLLLAPDKINEIKLKNHDKTFFIFNRLEYRFFDPKTNTWQTLPLTLENYDQIYKIISADESIDENKIKEIGLIKDNFGSTLSIYLKDKKEDKEKIFQEILFYKEIPYYRIEHPTDSNHSWIYFKHKNIEEKISKVINLQK